MNVRSKITAAILVMCCLAFPHPVFAYMDDVTILEQTEIVKLSDTQLVYTYIDVVVELEAGKAFHTTSGFKPKEYSAFKDLLRYRIHLLMELRKRGIEAPVLEP